MNLRCKPGDLVILLRTVNPRMKHMVGQIHVIGKESECFPGHWLFSPEVFLPSGKRVAWVDCDMRPIRDPGDDAVDETLRQLEAA